MLNLVAEAAAPAVPNVPRHQVQQTLEEDRLELVRRLDWRFLLPDPNLGSTAYLGCDQGTLVRALRHFSEEFVLFESQQSKCCEERQGRFDLVVCRSENCLPAAFEMLRSAGSLYWEVERLPFASRVLGASHGQLRDCVAQAQAAGFENVRAYWHRPDFENCLDIVPLQDSTALGYFFSRDCVGLKGAAKRVGGWLAIHFGLLDVLTRCVSVVGLKA